jgi:hypothetical protein
MAQQNPTSKGPASATKTVASAPGTNAQETVSAQRLDRLEALLLERMAGIADSVAQIKTGGGPKDAVGGEAGGPSTALANQCHTLGARLSLLEESFARICNVLGRLEQEFQAFKDAAGRDGQ